MLKRRATIARMMRMMTFLGRNDGAFSFTIIVGEKKAELATSDVKEKKETKDLLPQGDLRDAAVRENNVIDEDAALSV